MDTTQTIGMVRDIVFLSLLVIVLIIALLLALKIKSLIGAMKQSSRSANRAMDDIGQNINQTLPGGGTAAIGALVGLAIVMSIAKRKVRGRG